MSFHVRRIEKEKKPLPWRRMAGFVLVLWRPVLAFTQKVYAAQKKKHEKEVRAKRLFTLSFASIAAAVILILTVSLLFKVGAISLSSLMESTGAELAVDETGATNILLFGQGNEDHDGIDLTDTIMVASIGHSGGKPNAVLLSLPRDLYFLHPEKMEAGRLNTFWRDHRITLQREGKSREEASILALKEVAKEVGIALNIPMHYAVKVDFTAFEDIVDAFGGVDITVPEAIDDLEYPGPNFTFEPFHIKAGLQHMDGATALKYARTRHASSDFDRSARQQVILQALSEKAKASGLLTKPRKISELLSILSEHMESDLSLREMISLGSLGMDLPRENIVSMQLNNVNGLYGEQLFPGGFLYAPPRDLFEGASVLLPVSIPEFPVTWKQVHLFSSFLFGKRELYLQKPAITVFNAGAVEGSARKVGNELIKFGFNVEHIGNLPGQEKYETSFLSKNSANLSEEAFTFFSTLFSMEELALPADAKVEGNDIAIVLGKDFTFRPLQDLASPPSP